MADPSSHSQDEEKEFLDDEMEEEQESYPPTFDISLCKKGDDGRSFRTENYPAVPY
jgi:hypothetical protein